jgi:hypothetical protein
MDKTMSAMTKTEVLEKLRRRFSDAASKVSVPR